MRLGTFCLFVAVGFLATNSASAQNHDGLLTRLAARIQSHQHVHTHTHTVVAPPSAAAAAPTAAAAGAYSTGADPYGFMRVFNRIRARAGLPPVAYDPNLSSWARRNNLVQCARGLGHHVNPGGVQNCAWNYPDANSTVEGWMDSPGHRRNLLAPDITRFGIAFGPGPYWTLNAR